MEALITLADLLCFVFSRVDNPASTAALREVIVISFLDCLETHTSDKTEPKNHITASLVLVPNESF